MHHGWRIRGIFARHRSYFVCLCYRNGPIVSSGLGILEVKDRPARQGRNPATGETIRIAASKKVAFRVAKELKDAV
jgi:hypothetical protein